MASKQTLFQKLVNEKNAQAYEDKSGLKYSWQVRFIILLLTIVGCSFFFVFHLEQDVNTNNQVSGVVGSTWSEQSIISEYSFPIYKPALQYQNEINKAMKSVPSVFIFDKNSYKIAKDHWNLIEDLFSSYNESSESVLATPYLTESNIRVFTEMKKNQRLKFLSKAKTVLNEFIDMIYKNGFVDIAVSGIKTDYIILQTDDNQRKNIQTLLLTDNSTLSDKFEKNVLSRFDLDVHELLKQVVSENLRPNLLYSADLTNIQKAMAKNSVARTMGVVKKGEVIIDKNDVITDDHILKLNSYYMSENMQSESRISLTNVLGSIGHFFTIYTVLLFYLFYIRKKIFYDNAQLAIISVILILSSMLAWVSMEIPSSFPLEYLIVVPAFSMLAAIVFDSRTGFYVTVTIALLVAGIRGTDYITGVSLMFAGTLAAYTVKDIQNRTQMFQSIFFIFLGFLVPITAFNLERSMDMDIMIKQLILASVNSAISPLITFGMLIMTERISNIATDLRIQEFDSLNHPLLKKMSDIAPGTYQHTLSVATLAERCADAIGANPLLTKVGTYYHDIGKMSKAEYFTENQMDIGNKHDLLPPKKSAQAIKDHVSEGILLARQYKLPKRIIDFIPMHHGTTLIKHFYAKAVEQAAEDETVAQSDFRYPGPKPATKESAILMICDSAEAMSRIQVKDNSELEKMINNNIKDRLLDGQFDECEITMKDLETIKETIFKDLISRGHQRVKYKEIPKKDDKQESK